MPLPKEQKNFSEKAKLDLQKRQATLLREGVPGVLKEAAKEMYNNPVINAAIGIAPGAGDVQAGLEAAASAREGDWKGTLLNGIGVLPGIPALGGIVKSFDKTADALRAAPRAQEFEEARKEGVRLLGLPESNTAMDRAKAMGYDVDVYHGTRDDIKQIDKSKVKSNFDQSFGFHTSTNPDEANIYADSVHNFWAGYDPKSQLAVPVESGANVMPLLIKADNPLNINATRTTASMKADEDRSEIIHRLVDAMSKGNSHDVVNIKAGVKSDFGGDNVVVMKPSNIRSRFAAFNPAKADSTDVLAGVGAGGLGLAAALRALQEEEQYQ